MGNVSQVATTMKTALEQAARCVAAESSETYDSLDAQVETLEGQAYQAVKSQLDIASLLHKLREQEPLGPAELKTLELLIVGDAPGSTQHRLLFGQKRANHQVPGSNQRRSR